MDLGIREGTTRSLHDRAGDRDVGAEGHPGKHNDPLDRIAVRNDRTGDPANPVVPFAQALRRRVADPFKLFQYRRIGDVQGLRHERHIAFAQRRIEPIGPRLNELGENGLRRATNQLWIVRESSLRQGAGRRSPTGGARFGLRHIDG